jgi:hypothetical protein
MPSSSTPPSRQAPSHNSSDEALSVEELVSTVLNNTLAVFTTAPDRRSDWLETLQKWHAQASRQGHLGFARFVSVVQQLVAEGIQEPQEIELEEPYASAWQALVSAVNQTVEISFGGAPPESRDEQEPQTVEELLKVLTEETLTVLTVAPDLQEEWWAHLDEIQAQLEEAGDTQSALFVRALQHVGQESPERLQQIDWHQPFDRLRETLVVLSNEIPSSRVASKEMTAEQLLAVVAHNTGIVLAGSPERRETWSATLERLHLQALEFGDQDFATFLLAAQGLLAGEEPGALAPDLPEPYAAAWQDLITQQGAQAGQGTSGGLTNLAHILDLIVQTTVHVMHTAPQERETWWHALGEYRSQALEHEDAGFAEFLGGVRRLVEGSGIAELDLSLEGPYATAWEVLATQLDDHD